MLFLFRDPVSDLGPPLLDILLYGSMSNCMVFLSVFFNLATGRIPLDPSLTACLESGSSFAEKFSSSATFEAVQKIASAVLPSAISEKTPYTE